MYWGLDLAGRGAGYAWRRVLICAAEDVGLADVDTVMGVGQLYAMWRGTWDGSTPWSAPNHHLTMAIVLLCRAPKSTEIEDLQTWIQIQQKAGVKLPILPEYLDAHTKSGKAAKASWRDWYASRLAAGIPANDFTRRIWESRPEWKPELHDGSSPSESGERES